VTHRVEQSLALGPTRQSARVEDRGRLVGPGRPLRARAGVGSGPRGGVKALAEKRWAAQLAFLFLFFIFLFPFFSFSNSKSFQI
jgi:hypothetical protein